MRTCLHRSWLRRRSARPRVDRVAVTTRYAVLGKHSGMVLLQLNILSTLQRGVEESVVYTEMREVAADGSITCGGIDRVSVDKNMLLQGPGSVTVTAIVAEAAQGTDLDAFATSAGGYEHMR